MTLENLMTKSMLFTNSAIVLESIAEAIATIINPGDYNYTTTVDAFMGKPGLYVSLASASLLLSIVYKYTQKPGEWAI